MIFKDFVAGPWKRACYLRCKPSTRKRIDSALRTQLLPNFGSCALHRVSAEAVRHWFAHYSRTAPGGANRTLDVLSQILNHAVACEYLESNPTDGVVRNRRARLTRFLSRDEIKRLHAALNAHRGGESGRQQAEIIRLLLLTGCRKSELVNLKWSEVDGDALRLSDSKSGPRMVLLSSIARAILVRQPRTDSAHVFPAADLSGPRSSELALWRKVRRQAGIKDARLHDLRHTFASHAVMRNVPLPVISRLLGHAGTRITLRYAHIGDREIEAAAERVGAAIASTLAGRGGEPIATTSPFHCSARNAQD